MKEPRRKQAAGLPGVRRAPRSPVLAGLAAIACLAAGSIFYFRSPHAPETGAALQPLLAAGYVDSQKCANCHPKIWETYRRTGMGRSFARVRPSDMAQVLTQDSSFYHEPSGQYYSTYEKDGRYYQRRRQIGFEEKETNIVDKEIHFVVGSGNHVRTYLHQTPDGRIFELPVGWYAEKGGFWAMNPGYDRPDHDNFRRQINSKCVFCHTGYPEIEEGADRTGTEPVFRRAIPEGIDCQRCHGPGRGHIEAAQASPASREAILKTIVNPARLSPERRLEICMQCHLETTSFRLPPSIVRYSRGLFSYRPGEPLAGYILHFDHPAGAGHDDKFEIAGAAYRLRKSSCFRESAGSLQCTTCHNPHDIPRGAAAERHYTAACLTCHAAGLQGLIAGKRHTASQNCVGCHMPKRRTDDVVHAVMTDHFIQRWKPARDLLAALAEQRETEATAYKGEVVLYYPPKPDAEGEMYLAVAQVRQGANLKEGIPQLERAIEKTQPREGGFYFELAEAYWKSGQADRAIAAYEAALQRSPGFRPALRGLGLALAKSGRLDRAVDAMRKALTLMPDDPSTLRDLALVYLGQGRTADAVEFFRQALRADPELADAWNNLGGALLTLGDRTGAEEAFRNAIRVIPDFAAALQNLAGLLASRENFAEAEYFYRKAIHAGPALAAARYDFGAALANRERFREAAEQFEAAARLDPGNAATHLGLGDMAALLGNRLQAIRHYRRALEVKPDLAAGHLGLGTALAEMGKKSDAIPHLERAAGGSDPAVRQAARDALGALR